MQIYKQIFNYQFFRFDVIGFKLNNYFYQNIIDFKVMLKIALLIVLLLYLQSKININAGIIYECSIQNK